MGINVDILKSTDDLKLCFDIRFKVFIEEQGFDSEIELDEYDQVSYHVLITKDNIAIATARFFLVDSKYKIGRVCVLKEYRGLNLGKMLLDSIEEEVIKLNGKEMYLNAQYQTKSFYEKCGFVAIGDIFLEENCKHIKMIKKVG